MSDDLITVADFERAAEEKLDEGVAGYFFGGAGDELTLRENVAAWQGWRLRPRILAGLGEWRTGVEVLGKEASMPVLVAPVAYQGLVDPEGEAAMARAAAAADTVMCVSTLATLRPRQVAEAAPGGRRWFQLYCFRDEAVTRAMVEEACDCGYEAIVVTVDAPRGGNRERDRRTGFRIPEEVGVPSVEEALGSPRAVTIEETFALMEPALTWGYLEELAAECRVPVLVKGVLTGEDAARAVEHGLAGIVVSNHGGRQLDGAPSTISVLPQVVDAVSGRCDVLFDGGVQSGQDVLKALALGARGCLIGKTFLYALAAMGEKGVTTALDILSKELQVSLALTGTNDVREVSRDVLRA